MGGAEETRETWQSRLLAGDIAPLFTHPAVQLKAEVVVPVTVCQDLGTVFSATLFVALPVIGLREGPVPKKVRQRKLRV